MENSIAYVKSRQFAISVISLYRHLSEERHEFIMSRQVLRSGTSIGANLAEARRAISRAEFLSKIYISLKECSETDYWLDILHETNFISDVEYIRLHNACEEIIRILTATTRTMSED